MAANAAGSCAGVALIVVFFILAVLIILVLSCQRGFEHMH
jgi:hypothetical protein